MFKAIESSKIPSITTFEDLRAGNWREDVLTAAVFSRLSYLPGHAVWNILLAAANASSDIVRYRSGSLTECQFWPRYEASSLIKNSTVEPDVVMKLELGNPAVSVAVIIEAKRTDESKHTVDQWEREVSAVRKRETEVDKVVLFAVGGLGRHGHFSAEMLKHAEKAGTGSFHGLSWSGLRNEIEKLNNVSNGPTRAILSDAMGVLEHAGFNGRKYLGSMKQTNRLRWKSKTVAKAFAQMKVGSYDN